VCSQAGGCVGEGEGLHTNFLTCMQSSYSLDQRVHLSLTQLRVLPRGFPSGRAHHDARFEAPFSRG
jgi:hypothetical protein